MERIVTDIPAPGGNENDPLRALIFDSYYDAYRGVIVYVRIKDGQVRPGDTIRMMATGGEFNVVECGFLRATTLEPAEALYAGEVGYIAASIKDVRQARVGDTVTLKERPAAEPLEGYRAVQPMVFCGIYPADGAHYTDLRDALEKLQLNDASLTFEPETSVALGFGFRCGFLGLLHMEIIQERLEREYDIGPYHHRPQRGVQAKAHRRQRHHSEIARKAPRSPSATPTSTPPRSTWATSWSCARSAGACSRT